MMTSYRACVIQTSADVIQEEQGQFVKLDGPALSYDRTRKNRIQYVDTLLDQESRRNVGGEGKYL